MVVQIVRRDELACPVIEAGDTGRAVLGSVGPVPAARRAELEAEGVPPTAIEVTARPVSSPTIEASVSSEPDDAVTVSVRAAALVPDPPRTIVVRQPTVLPGLDNV